MEKRLPIRKDLAQHLCFKQKEKMTLGTSDTEISFLCHDKYQGDIIAK